MTGCAECMLWEFEIGMSAEAYASTAIEWDITAAELRGHVLAKVHAQHGGAS